MRWSVKTVFVLTSLLLLCSTASAISITQIIKDINPDQTTSEYRKVFWKDMKGKKVSWTGKLYKVRGGFREVYKVFVKVGKPQLGNYNVIMTVEDQPRIARMKKGATLRFTGTLYKYKWSRPKPVKQSDGSIKYVRQFVIYLDDAHIDFGKGS